MKMKKVRTLLCTLMAWMPVAVMALGLGDITVNSQLNQPLDAKIAVLGANNVARDQVTFGIASRAAFEKAGIDYPFLLNKIRFRWDTDNSGATYLKLSTQESIREPYLNFLIDIQWPAGRLLREYTVLLDPPVFAANESPFLIAPPSSAQASTTTDSHAAVGEQAHGAEQDIATGTAGTGGGESHILLSAAGLSEQYGPTKQGETLWKIALATRAPNLSVQQQMIALFQANPQAFIQGNINRLMAEQILNIPAPEVAQGISRSDAIQMVAAHNKAWQTVTAQPTPSQAPLLAQDINAQKAASSNNVPASKADNHTDQALTPDEHDGYLRIVTPESGAGLVASSEVDKAIIQASAEHEKVIEKLKEDLLVANEALDTAKRSNEDLTEQVSDKESQINSLQALLELKDEEIGDLETRNEAQSKQIQSLQAVGSKVLPAPGEVRNADLQNEVHATKSKPEIPESTLPPPLSNQESRASPPEQTPAMATIGSEMISPFQAQEKGVSFIEDILNNRVKFFVFVAVILGCIAMLWLLIEHLWTRRDALPKEKQQDIHTLIGSAEASAETAASQAPGDDSVSTQGEATVLAETADSEGDEQAAAVSGETTVVGPDEDSNASETTITEPEQDIPQEAPIEPDTVFEVTQAQQADGEPEPSLAGQGADPLGEADIYISYEQYDQAEALLQVALNAQPHDDDLRVKLLQVYALMEDRQAFDEHMGLLPAQWKSNDDARWQRVLQWRSEAWPDISWPIASEQSATQPHQLDPLATDRQDQEQQHDKKAFVESTTQDDAYQIANQYSEEKLIEFEVSPQDPHVTQVQSEQVLQQFEVDDDAATQAGVVDAEKDDDNSAVIEWPEQFEGSDIEEASVDEYPAITTEAGSEISLSNSDSEQDDDEDEMTTKLDLARAYLDMGDHDGAREILEEVLSDGNQGQQNDARHLLRGLDVA